MRLVALLWMVLLATPPLRAQARFCRADPVIGGDLDDRARLATLLGSARGDELLLRSLSSRQAPLDTARGRLRWCGVRPEITIVHNSAIPFSLNHGPLWAGRGWSEDVRAGFRAQWGRVSIVVAPELVATDNLPYEMPPAAVQLPRPAGRSSFSTPWHVGSYSIDLPLRFGEWGFWRLDPGQSTLAAAVGPVVAGFSTDNEWWGPGIQNAIVLSNNAPGIPRVFARTSHPLRTPVGTFAARWFLGGLSESPYFDTSPQDDRRSITALATTWTAGSVPTLTLGFTRAVYTPLARWGDIVGHVFDVVRDLGWHVAPGDSVPTPHRDQIFSFFGRWIFPADGFAVHVEWARTDPPHSLRDLLTAPNRSQGYTLGLEWARPLRAERDALRVQAEVTYLEQSPAFRNFAQATFYTGTAARQGYTQRGQVIGAAIGPGASSQWLAVDYFAPAWHVGLFGGRIRWDDDALYLFPVTASAENKWCSHDVSLFGGISAGGDSRWGRIRVALSRGERLNMFFYHLTLCGTPDLQYVLDVRNTTFEIRLSPP